MRRSVDLGGPHTIEQLAGDVLVTMEALGLNRADIIGHSLGARIAAEICRQQSDDARSVLDPVVLWFAAENCTITI